MTEGQEFFLGLLLTDQINCATIHLSFYLNEFGYGWFYTSTQGRGRWDAFPDQQFALDERSLCWGSCNHLDISNAAVSQHLQILRETGLMRGEKRGYWTHYSVDGFRELVLLCGFIRNVEKGTPDPCAWIAGDLRPCQSGGPEVCRVFQGNEAQNHHRSRAWCRILTQLRAFSSIQAPKQAIFRCWPA